MIKNLGKDQNPAYTFAAVIPKQQAGGDLGARRVALARTTYLGDIYWGRDPTDHTSPAGSEQHSCPTTSSLNAENTIGPCLGHKKGTHQGRWPVSFRKVPLSSRHDGQDKRCVGIAERSSQDVPRPVFSCVTWPAHQKLVLHFFLVGVPRS